MNNYEEIDMFFKFNSESKFKIYNKNTIDCNCYDYLNSENLSMVNISEDKIIKIKQFLLENRFQYLGDVRTGNIYSTSCKDSLDDFSYTLIDFGVSKIKVSLSLSRSYSSRQGYYGDYYLINNSAGGSTRHLFFNSNEELKEFYYKAKDFFSKIKPIIVDLGDLKIYKNKNYLKLDELENRLSKYNLLKTKKFNRNSKNSPIHSFEVFVDYDNNIKACEGVFSEADSYWGYTGHGSMTLNGDSKRYSCTTYESTILGLEKLVEYIESTGDKYITDII